MVSEIFKTLIIAINYYYTIYCFTRLIYSVVKSLSCAVYTTYARVFIFVSSIVSIIIKLENFCSTNFSNSLHNI